MRKLATRNANALKTFHFQSATSKNKGRQHLLLSKNCIILSIFCFSVAIVVFGTSHLFRNPANGGGGNLVGYSTQRNNEHRCWLQHAFESGDFKLFSHRSYHDNTQLDQPTCRDSLEDLQGIGVNHLDLDLVLDKWHHGENTNNQSRLVVAHPMEFKRQSDYYSPCANMSLDDMIETLKNVYGNDFFISMEPKAAWGKTQKELEDVALTNLPSTILEELLEKIDRHNLDGKCAVIVDIKDVQESQELEKEEGLVNRMMQHCQLFKGIRLADDAPDGMGDYDRIMPTIEFHPSHPHNTDGKVLPLILRSKSIFWVVDNENDLDLAASLHPFGVVSNSPKNIVQIIEDPRWCKE